MTLTATEARKMADENAHKETERKRHEDARLQKYWDEQEALIWQDIEKAAKKGEYKCSGFSNAIQDIAVRFRKKGFVVYYKLGTDNSSIPYSIGWSGK